MPRRIVNLSVLPGEPTDGSGRVCVHLVIPDDAGPFVEPFMLQPRLDESGQPIKGQAEARPTRCRLACDPKRTVAPVTHRGVTTVTMRTGDPRAVTCPKCIESETYRLIMEAYKE